MIYFVATPIGNLKDITLRALDVLREADVIFCEDTRHSLRLFEAYGIKKPLLSCHKFNERAAADKIMAEAKSGKNVAVVSDAGMPAISDPGNIVCGLLRREGLPYTVIPGANAALSALVLSALNSTRFAFLGFLPEKKAERTALLTSYKNLGCTLIFHAAPQDVDGYIADMYSVFGNRQACAVREITKIHEEVAYFALQEGLQGEKRGEYVLLVEGAKEQNPLNSLPAEEHIRHYMALGMDKKEAVKQVAADRGVPKQEIYKIAIDLK